MSKTIADCHLSLAYRLGESSTPVSVTEKAKRLNWFRKAVDLATADEPMWFTRTKGTLATVAGQPRYSFPADWRQTIQIKIDGYKYDKIPDDEVYQKYEVPTAPVPILPSFMKRAYYEFGSEFNPIPIPSAAPTVVSVASITRSGNIATVTTSTPHGYYTDDYVTIAGATQADYNGKYRITVVSTTVFTYTVANSPVTPATGTITATKDNILIWYFNYPTLPTLDTSGIVVPDAYEDLLVSYAEGRYWSSAHKRGKASDAFTEFEDILRRLKTENFRHKFMQLNG